MYCDRETESDILLKLINALREDIDTMKSNQADFNQYVAKVIGFVKRLKLSQGEEEGNSDLPS